MLSRQDPGNLISMIPGFGVAGGLGVSPDETIECPVCRVDLRVRRLKQHLIRAHGLKRKIQLASRRGTRVTGGGLCARCGTQSRLIWRYQKTTRGKIHVCDTCKQKLLDESFGRKDALDHAVSGGFEQNRRRY